MTTPLLAAHHLTRHYRSARPSLFARPSRFTALEDVSFTLVAGQNLGIVGESGSGKSTLARLILGLEKPDSGHVELFGHDLRQIAPKALRELRPQAQMMFQDPWGSLDPRFSVEQLVGEPLSVLKDLNAGQKIARIAETLGHVGLGQTDMHKYPHEFSGGQRQRIALARALVTRPRLIVADEPVSALDVSIQAQVLNLMQDVQRNFGVTFLLISHDLAVVSHLCPRVIILHKGAIVEEGHPRDLFTHPAHAVTQRLVAALPHLPDLSSSATFGAK